MSGHKCKLKKTKFYIRKILHFFDDNEQKINFKVSMIIIAGYAGAMSSEFFQYKFPIFWEWIVGSGLSLFVIVGIYCMKKLFHNLSVSKVNYYILYPAVLFNELIPIILSNYEKRNLPLHLIRAYYNGVMDLFVIYALVVLIFSFFSPVKPIRTGVLNIIGDKKEISEFISTLVFWGVVLGLCYMCKYNSLLLMVAVILGIASLLHQGVDYVEIAQSENINNEIQAKLDRIKKWILSVSISSVCFKFILNGVVKIEASKHSLISSGNEGRTSVMDLIVCVFCFCILYIATKFFLKIIGQGLVKFLNWSVKSRMDE